MVAHDRAEIGQQCAALDGSLDPRCLSAEGRTTFAWILRCPGEPEEAPVADAIAALALARDVHHGALPRLPGEVRP